MEKALKYYGNVSHFLELRDKTCNVKTGVRIATFTSLDHEIPSFIYAGKHQIRCDYYGQQKTCRKCQQTGHIARDCQAGQVCRVCGSPDHTKRDCPNQRCYYCQETGHLEAVCPKYLKEFPGLGGNIDDHRDSDIWAHSPDTEHAMNTDKTMDNDIHKTDANALTITPVLKNTSQTNTDVHGESQIQNTTNSGANSNVNKTIIETPGTDKNQRQAGNTPQISGDSPPSASKSDNNNEFKPPADTTREQQKTGTESDTNSSKETENKTGDTMKTTLTDKDSEMEYSNTKRGVEDPRSPGRKKKKKRSPIVVSGGRSRHPKSLND